MDAKESENSPASSSSEQGLRNVSGSPKERLQRASSKPVGGRSGGSFRSAVMRGMGVMRDGLTVASPAVESGFEAALGGARLGFSLSRQALAAPFTAFGVEESPAHRSFESVLTVAETITTSSIQASGTLTQASMAFSENALSLAGARRGETHRLLTEYVASQAGQDGHEVKESLLGLATLLVELGGKLTVKDPLKLLAGAQALSLVHAQGRAERIGSRALGTLPPPDLPTSQDLLGLAKFMHYAAAAYGFHVVQLLGMVPTTKIRANVTSDEAAILALTSVSHEDILVLQSESVIYRPCHFVAVLHEKRQVVISIRGTISVHDVLVDLVCESAPFDSVFDDDSTFLKGWVHRGFLKSAQRLANDLHEPVKEALDANPGYELVITGHSLGGGVATVLTLMWARMPYFRKHNIRAFAFAAPCSVCEEISRAPYTKRHVTSVVTGDDIVSRLSLASFKDLQRALVTLAPRSDLPLKEKHKLLAKLPKEEKRLYCAGRVWWLESEEYAPEPIVEVDPIEELHSIELFSNVVGIHLPHSYIRSLDKLAGVE